MGLSNLAPDKLPRPRTDAEAIEFYLKNIKSNGLVTISPDFLRGKKLFIMRQNDRNEYISTMGTVSEFCEYAKKLRKVISKLQKTYSLTKPDYSELEQLRDILENWTDCFETWIAEIEAP